MQLDVCDLTLLEQWCQIKLSILDMEFLTVLIPYFRTMIAGLKGVDPYELFVVCESKGLYVEDFLSDVVNEKLALHIKHYKQKYKNSMSVMLLPKKVVEMAKLRFEEVLEDEPTTSTQTVKIPDEEKPRSGTIVRKLVECPNCLKSFVVSSGTIRCRLCKGPKKTIYCSSDCSKVAWKNGHKSSLSHKKC